MVIERIIMKTCFYCPDNFQPLASEKGCTIKCKLLGDIKKENECWFFKNSTSGIYSKIWWNKKWYSAHRCSYEVFVGPIKDGMHVLHKCDQPKCINPEHLFLGTIQDNAKDRQQKSRNVKGEKCHLSKFTDKQIKEMRLLKQEGFTYVRLSRIFNCTMSHLLYVIKQKVRKEG